MRSFALPQGWVEVRLGEVASVSRGASPRPIASSRWFSDSSNVGWVRIADLGRSNGLLLKTTTQRLSPDGIARSRFLQPGTLIMSIAATVGLPILTGIPACIHDGFVAIERLQDVDQGFLLYALKSLEAVLRSAGQTGSQSNVNTEIVRGLRIKLPPIDEQEKIAGALQDIDRLIIGLQRLITKKQGIKQGMMQELLTGRTRIGGYQSTWRTVSLIEVADKRAKNSFVGGPFGSSLTASEYTTSGVQILQLQNIGDGHFRSDYAIYTSAKKADELSTNNIFPGDILIAKMGDPVARACIAPAYAERYVMASDGIRLSVDRDRFSPLLVKELINQPTFRAAAEAVSTGSTRKRIALGALRKLQLVLPSELAEQQAIATALSDVDTEIDALRSRLEKARLIKLGIMQELLTGRTRLPVTEVVP